MRQRRAVLPEPAYSSALLDMDRKEKLVMLPGISCLPVGTLAVLVAALTILTPSVASAEVDLEWRPGNAATYVGDSVGLGLFAVSDSAELQSSSGLQIVFAWDAAHLRLVGLDPTGGVDLSMSGFPSSGDCDLNEADPPADGDGFYRAGVLGEPIPVPPEGVLLTTFVFEALAPSDDPVTVSILRIMPNGTCRTMVVDGVVPGLEVTGELGTALLAIGCRYDEDCNDGLACTVDSCRNETGSCIHQPDDALCDNGLYCDGSETCDAHEGCRDGVPPCLPDLFCDEDTDGCVECLAFGDVTGDARATLEDAAAFEGCLTSPLGPTDPSLYEWSCRCLDHDEDGDIDLGDFAAFQIRFSAHDG